jgi:hypothetical protein
LDANCAYYFGRNQWAASIYRESASVTTARPLKAASCQTERPRRSRSRKILSTKARTPRHLGAAAQAASKRRRPFERNYHVAFRVVAVGTCKSDNSITDFFDTGRAQHKVDPAAKVAIGFTSQWPMAWAIRMAGTRTAPCPHPGPRRLAEINEAERLGFLYTNWATIWARSQSEWQSVMRPVLGDKRAGRNDFEFNSTRQRSRWQ